MTVLSDKWIKKMAKSNKMITPFVPKQVRKGKISFGLYCYHGLIIAIILKLDLNQSLLFNIIIYPILILISTIFISYISYEYYELKFLKLKTRYTLSN